MSSLTRAAVGATLRLAPADVPAALHAPAALLAAASVLGAPPSVALSSTTFPRPDATTPDARAARRAAGRAAALSHVIVRPAAGPHDGNGDFTHSPLTFLAGLTANAPAPAAETQHPMSVGVSLLPSSIPLGDAHAAVAAAAAGAAASDTPLVSRAAAPARASAALARNALAAATAKRNALIAAAAGVPAAVHEDAFAPARAALVATAISDLKAKAAARA